MEKTTLKVLELLYWYFVGWMGRIIFQEAVQRDVADLAQWQQVWLFPLNPYI